MSADVTIEVADRATQEVLDGLNRILPQLSSSAPPLALVELDEICVNDTVFIARDSGVIVGSLTLVIFRGCGPGSKMLWWMKRLVARAWARS
jgi:hypothetical protein